MKSIRGLTKGIDESLRGAAGVFEIMSNKTFGRFSTPTKVTKLSWHTCLMIC